jgi:hypothetical protein
MNRLLLLAAGVAALSLGACHRDIHRGRWHEPLKTISKLDCPDAQGELKRVSASPDGLTCAYQGDNTEVSLRLISLTNGDAQAALTPIETELKTLMPPPAPPPAAPGAPGVDDDNDKVSIDFPGLHVRADNGNAEVRVGGIHVDADDAGAQVRMGGNTAINADDRGAEIRQARSSEAGVRSTFILASDKMPSGYHVVGYEARGPKAGPIVVAVVKSKADHNEHDAFDDMKALVTLNVGR